MNFKFYIASLIIVAVVTSSLTIFLYNHYIIPSDRWISSLRKDVHSMAEKGVLLSPKLLEQYKAVQPSDFVVAAEKSRKAVVFIKSNSSDSDNEDKDVFQGLTTGSGVIVSPDGYIVTNYHVVKEATKIDITLDDNRAYEAKMVGYDESTDLALLRIAENDLDFLLLGNSDSLFIGEWVLAVGNPFKLQSSVTAGIVSAKARNINVLTSQGIESFIQTDAAINPGNSGGALVNTRGDLVGICTAIKSYSGRFEGFSFAIPSNLVSKVVADLMEHGVVQRGWLGIEIENVDNTTAQNLSLNEISGVHISSVKKEGSAFKAGLRSGDVVHSINNTKVNNVPEFMEIMARYSPGEKIVVIYTRFGKKYTTEAVLLNQLNTEFLMKPTKFEIFSKIGFEIRLPDMYEQAVVASNGLIVQSVQRGTTAAQTRMEPGYVITKINNITVKSPKQLADVLIENKGKSIIMEGFYPKVPGEFPYTFIVP